jgi:hypothetical protein
MAAPVPNFKKIRRSMIGLDVEKDASCREASGCQSDGGIVFVAMIYTSSIGKAERRSVEQAHA